MSAPLLVPPSSAPPLAQSFPVTLKFLLAHFVNPQASQRPHIYIRITHSPLPSPPSLPPSPTTPKAWEMMSTALRKANTKVLKADDVLAAQAKGAVIVDIRPRQEFEKGYIEGSVNVPLYRLIESWTPMQVARRIGFAFFGERKTIGEGLTRNNCTATVSSLCHCKLVSYELCAPSFLTH